MGMPGFDKAGEYVRCKLYRKIRAHQQPRSCLIRDELGVFGPLCRIRTINLNNPKKAALIATASLLLLPGSSWLASERLRNAIESVSPTDETKEVEKVEEKSAPVRLSFTCKNCTSNESVTLAFLQKEAGVRDKNALATIMGNIKQESNFHPNICEGGARIAYSNCYRGGYGLIQWTSTNRYYGLGRHANAKGLSPSAMMAQLSWLITEPQWRSIEHRMKTPGLSINSYMNAAYSWIGWGIHGSRTHYAYDYANRFTLSV